MLEILPARKYYGRHATGTVLLVDGQPWHFTGKDALKEARETRKRIEARRKQ